jgi:hypothetical protein
MSRRPDSWEDPPEDEPEDEPQAVEPDLNWVPPTQAPYQDRDCDYWNNLK